MFRLVEEPPEDWNGRYCITGNATPQCANNLQDSFVLKCSPVELSYKAVLWAFENGVTGGTSDTNFSPKNLCTREQVVTFLYKVFGQDD